MNMDMAKKDLLKFDGPEQRPRSPAFRRPVVLFVTAVLVTLSLQRFWPFRISADILKANTKYSKSFRWGDVNYRIHGRANACS